MKQSLFQYAILFHPTEEEMEKGQKSKVLSDLKTILAVNQNSAFLAAAKQIPDGYEDKLDQVEIAIRPF